MFHDYIANSASGNQSRIVIGFTINFNFTINFDFTISFLIRLIINDLSINCYGYLTVGLLTG